ncbi:MAG: hypothetical protein M3O36_10305 [Myxococcota bacterium]|nr:hypothetical protein [Myxococcota bacterium]
METWTWIFLIAVGLINGILEPQKSHVAYVQREQHVEQDKGSGPGGEDQSNRPPR